MDAQIELDRLNSDIETTQKQCDTMNKELANVKDEDQRLEYTNLIQTKENSLKKSQYDLKKQNVTIEQLKNTIADRPPCSPRWTVLSRVSTRMPAVFIWIQPAMWTATS